MCRLQGNVAARRAAYEARWHSFGQIVKAGGKDLRYAQVPWPAEDDQGIRAVLLYGTSTADEVYFYTAQASSLSPLAFSSMPRQ